MKQKFKFTQEDLDRMMDEAEVKEARQAKPNVLQSLLAKSQLSKQGGQPSQAP